MAYPYAFPAADYRKPYAEVGKAFGVRFIYADEEITDLNVLDKIKGYILGSAFGIYDITNWNANVTLELGLALGLNQKAYTAFNPSAGASDAPADLRGRDRLQYSSMSELGEKLERIVATHFPVPRSAVENEIDTLRRDIVSLAHPTDGLRISDIAKALGISIDLAKLVVRPMVGVQLRADGQTRGTRYYLKP
ncbi:hypothetical protein F1C58_09075 [Glaciihabitans sp. INWT7]|uniref:hypothetical protein n=1 Tax=Glaciihabitans sp. INWT7 TaxID=2596912 RepID=UPI0016262883|nr:hypothetical protein [Glaciihabitans sp. INWT7]QNE47033.1 hypothetical protein F1C58_09075 [Glaciihabitans sp. INWT7]